MNNNTIVQNAKRSSPGKGILPAWAAGEKLYGQKFFYHGMYISTLFNDNEHKDLQPSTSEIRDSPTGSVDLLTMLESFENNRKRFAFPDPAKSTQNVLNSLSVISSGIHNLFPNGMILNRLSSSMGESDNIYLILGLYSLLCKLDLALEKQIIYSIKKLKVNIELPDKTLNVINSLIAETFMKHNLSKQGTSNQTATKLDLNLGEPRNQKSVAGSSTMNAGEPSNQESFASNSAMNASEPSNQNDAERIVQNPGEIINPKNKTWRTNRIQKKYFFNQHQMEFIDEKKYVCYGCAGIFTSDPSCHIINPIHIKANYKPAPSQLGV